MSALLGVGTLLAGILFSGEAWPWVQVTTVDDGYVLQWDQRAMPARVVLRVGGRGADCLGRGSWEAYGPCLDDVIRHAADAWVQTGADIEIVSESEKSTEACVSGDGVSTVTLGTDYCGNRWGDAVGITMYQTAWLSPGDWDFPDGRPIKITEVDIVFNTGNFPGRPGVPIRWASYNGPSRYSPIDIHRVALHEFGHFWGLAHPDEHGQTVRAIMNSGGDQYDHDRLQPDDVQGITTIYPQTNGLVQARVYAIPPITARDQAAVRIHCEGLDGEACTVHLDCTDPEGAEYAGPVSGTIPAFGTRTLTAQDIVEITGGEPWRGRLTCALRSKRAVTGQVWTRSGDGVLVNNTAASRSFLLEYAGKTWQAARVYSIQSPTSSDVTNLRVRCESPGAPCENVMLFCANDNGELHSGAVVERIEPRATYHMQAAEIERVIDYQWRGMGLSCFVVSTRDISVQVLTRTGGGVLVNNSAVDPPR